jgi:hypothetical protein
MELKRLKDLEKRESRKSDKFNENETISLNKNLMSSSSNQDCNQSDVHMIDSSISP